MPADISKLAREAAARAKARRLAGVTGGEGAVPVSPGVQSVGATQSSQGASTAQEPRFVSALPEPQPALLEHATGAGEFVGQREDVVDQFVGAAGGGVATDLSLQVVDQETIFQALDEQASAGGDLSSFVQDSNLLLARRKRVEGEGDSRSVRPRLALTGPDSADQGGAGSAGGEGGPQPIRGVATVGFMDCLTVTEATLNDIPSSENLELVMPDDISDAYGAMGSSWSVALNRLIALQRGDAATIRKNKSLQRQNDYLLRRVSDLTADVGRSGKELADFKLARAVWEEDKKALGDVAATWERRYNESRAANEEKLKTIAALNAAVEDLQKDVDSLRRTNGVLSGKVDKIGESWGRSLADQSACHAVILGLEERVAVLEREKAVLAQEKADLDVALGEATFSTFNSALGQVMFCNPGVFMDISNCDPTFELEGGDLVLKRADGSSQVIVAAGDAARVREENLAREQGVLIGQEADPTRVARTGDQGVEDDRAD